MKYFIIGFIVWIFCGCKATVDNGNTEQKPAPAPNLTAPDISPTPSPTPEPAPVMPEYTPAPGTCGDDPTCATQCEGQFPDCNTTDWLIQTQCLPFFPPSSRDQMTFWDCLVDAPSFTQKYNYTFDQCQHLKDCKQAQFP